jgi:hypothetical protein
MVVRGIEHMTLGDLVEQVKLGGRFVVYHACVGLLVATVQWPSEIQFLRGCDPAGRGGWRTVFTLLAGWWAIPFGPRATLACLRENLAGGRDVTAIVLQRLLQAERHPVAHPAPVTPPITSHAA